MGDEQQGERLARVEERLSSIEGAVFRVEARLESWHSQYPTRMEVAEMFRSRDEQFAMLREEKQTNKQVWPQWATVAISIVTLCASVWIATH